MGVLSDYKLKNLNNSIEKGNFKYAVKAVKNGWAKPLSEAGGKDYDDFIDSVIASKNKNLIDATISTSNKESISNQILPKLILQENLDGVSKAFEEGAEFNKDNSKYVPIAVKTGNKDLLKEIITNGGDPNAKISVNIIKGGVAGRIRGVKNVSPLEYAVTSNKNAYELTEILLEHGAKPETSMTKEPLSMNVSDDRVKTLLQDFEKGKRKPTYPLTKNKPEEAKQEEKSQAPNINASVLAGRTGR